MARCMGALLYSGGVCRNLPAHDVDVVCYYKANRYIKVQTSKTCKLICAGKIYGTHTNYNMSIVWLTSYTIKRKECVEGPRLSV